jgi:transcriptional regulator with XRE-family HTH domain
MSPIRHIRVDVLGLTQAELGDLVGVRQATVSRWEAGHSGPTLKQLQRIRNEARRRKLRWDDRWFFAASEAA